jgi:hypothetical protein
MICCVRLDPQESFVSDTLGSKDLQKSSLSPRCGSVISEKIAGKFLASVEGNTSG